MFYRIFFIILLTLSVWGCGKIGPLGLQEDKLDKSVITYPCDKECLKKFEEEINRQQSVILQSE